MPDLVADTGCTVTLLTPEFSQFVVGKSAEGTQRVLLGGKGHVLKTGPQQELHLPVRDVKGHRRQMQENGIISADVRYPLLACAEKALVKGMPGQASAVEVRGDHGQKFWVPVVKAKGLPVIAIDNDKTALSLGNCVTIEEKRELEKQRRLTSATLNKNTQANKTCEHELQMGLHKNDIPN